MAKYHTSILVLLISVNFVISFHIKFDRPKNQPHSKFHDLFDDDDSREQTESPRRTLLPVKPVKAVKASVNKTAAAVEDDGKVKEILEKYSMKRASANKSAEADVKPKLKIPKRNTSEKVESSADKPSVAELPKPKPETKPPPVAKPAKVEEKKPEKSVKAEPPIKKPDKPKPAPPPQEKPKPKPPPPKPRKPRAYDLLKARYFERFYYSFPTFAPNYTRIDNLECRVQGQIVRRQLKAGKVWAMKMLDSTAKLPPGILQGNLNQLGDYDECLDISTRLLVSESRHKTVNIQGKYCLVHVDIEAVSEDMKLPVNLMQARGFLKSKYEDPGHFIPRFSTLHWGVCVPAGCDADDVEQIMRDSLRPYNYSKSTGLLFKVHATDDDCTTATDSAFTWSIPTILTIGLLTTIAVIVVVATIRDYWRNVEDDGTVEKALMSFSLKRTVSDLLKSEFSATEITCVYGIRGVCTIMLYLAHKLIPIGGTPYSNRIQLTTLANGEWSSLFRGSLIYTDSFLLLSGLLSAYNMSRDLETKNTVDWFNRFVSRFLRLTPALACTVLFYAYIFEFLGSGPLWNSQVGTNADLCKENLWRNLLYIQNFFPFEETCGTHTHQLALDMQLSLLAPILVWFLYRRPFIGVILVTGLNALSVGLRFYYTSQYQLSLFIYHGITLSQLYRTANKSYGVSLHRATPYIAGVCLGVLLRQISKRDFYLPKFVGIAGWLMTAYFTGWAIYTPSHQALRTYEYNVVEAAQYASLVSVAWALSLSWVIFYCYVEPDSLINQILKSKPLVFLSRISYSIYLTQFVVFFYNLGVARTSTEFDIYSALNISEIIAVITLATIVTLTLDLPMQHVKTQWFYRVHESSSEEENEGNGETGENLDNEEEQKATEEIDSSHVVEESEEENFWGDRADD